MTKIRESDKPVISSPLNFEHTVHVGFDPHTGEFTVSSRLVSPAGCKPYRLSCSTILLFALEMRENYLTQAFLAPLAVGQRAYAMVCCLSCVRPSVRPLTFSLNIFFSETTDWILMKFHRNVPAMVLFRISWNNLILSKPVVAMATKLKIIWKLWKSSCQKP